MLMTNNDEENFNEEINLQNYKYDDSVDLDGVCGAREFVTPAHFTLGPKARADEGHCRKHTTKVQVT